MSVAQEFGTYKSVISQYWKVFHRTGKVVRKVCGGRPNKTTANDGRYIVLRVKRKRNQTVCKTAQYLCITTVSEVSTVAIRLHKGGLFACRPERCMPFIVAHRRHRLEWCNDQTSQEWCIVLFTDESRLSLSNDSQRQLIRREVETLFHSININEKDPDMFV